MNNISKNSFTLIELLVVIAIIGILAGVIIVSMAGATDSANLAKVKVFAISMRDSMGQNIISEWKFDGNANDTWSNNNGTWAGPSGTNTTANYRPESECVFGQCLNFDGTDDGVNCGNADVFNFGANDFSISVFVKASVLNNDNRILTKWTNGNSGWGLDIYNTGGFVDLVFNDGTNSSRVRSTSIITAGKWYHIAVTRSGTDAKIYVNGNETSYAVKNSVPATITANTNNLFIGRDTSTSWFLNGAIDDLRIYSTALSLSQVKNIYTAGLKSLLAKTK
jgi:prepilin-type N-terminal cleavage/methylation domain-containing protein